MNKQRRAQLRIAITHLEQAADIVEVARDEEQDCFDALPENLQSSERAAAMEEAIDELSEAIEKINDATESIDRASGE